MTIPGIPETKKELELFRAHYEVYYPKVLKHLFFLLGGNDFNEDITHDVFMKYWDAPPGTIEYPGAWLCKIATHLALNHVRGEKRRAAREENLMENTLELFTAEEAFVRREDVKQVREILRQLPEEHRMCLTLKFSGYSYDEISQATGIPRGNIGQYIARGKSRFASLFEKAGGDRVL